MRPTTSWPVPAAFTLGLAAGVLIGLALPTGGPGRRAASDAGVAGSVFVIGVDPDLGEAAVYTARYDPDVLDPLAEWRHRQARFTFRREVSARRANDAVMAALRGELARSLRED